jgi:predicted metal-dependent hydrolase
MARMESGADYDPRYLAGILFFNQRDFFEAHEVWEDLWAESAGLQRSFYQGLIQAAVGLFHFSGGNLRGAAKLYRTSRAYMEPCGTGFLGLDVAAFWERMERCFAALLATEPPDPALRPVEEEMPVITLAPPPVSWPNLDDFAGAEE